MNLEEIYLKVRESQEKLNNTTTDTARIINKIKEEIEKNLDVYEEAYEKDCHEKLLREKFIRQFEVDYKISSEVFKNEYGKVANVDKPYGVIGVSSNCDIYNIARIATLAIATRNGLIIDINNNIGTNYFVIDSIKNVLKRYDLENVIGLYSNNAGIKLEEYEKLDALIYIGKKANCERVRISNTIPIIYSGCGNYEIYIEDDFEGDLLENLANMSNVKMYSLNNISKGQVVANIDEAIARINESGNEYAVGIITKNQENSKKFIGSIKSRNIFINASPTLMDNKLDIEAKELTKPVSVLVY